MIPDIDLQMQVGPHVWSPVTVRRGFLWLRKRTYCKGCYLTQRRKDPMSGLWEYGKKASEGKFLVQRRDGTVPEWPSIVLGARDPAAPTALLAYAAKAERLGYDKQYVEDVRRLAAEFDQYEQEHGEGDPDAPPHRKDDPEIIAKMRKGRGS